MDRKAFLNQVKEVFDANELAEKYYVTRDAQCFAREADAINHQRFLGPHNSGVEPITREGLKAMINGKVVKIKDEGLAAGAGEDEQGGKSSSTVAAASDSAPGTSAPGETDEERTARETDENAADEAAAAAEAAKEVAAPKAAAKKAAPKKAATKKPAAKKAAKRK
jgi:hypothetical protein